MCSVRNALRQGSIPSQQHRRDHGSYPQGRTTEPFGFRKNVAFRPRASHPPVSGKESGGPLPVGGRPRLQSALHRHRIGRPRDGHTDQWDTGWSRVDQADIPAVCTDCLWFRHRTRRLVAALEQRAAAISHGAGRRQIRPGHRAAWRGAVPQPLSRRPVGCVLRRWVRRLRHLPAEYQRENAHLPDRELDRRRRSTGVLSRRAENRVQVEPRRWWHLRDGANRGGGQESHAGRLQPLLVPGWNDADIRH